ncbi:hypothetical protein CPC08DRAFT_665210 [Agrocybe pediades]|nr:hypothetical protein CPC08DRAFT_665210 [Agrocybe pediades]
MSLPAAPKDISTHPVKGSVVDPIDRNQKEADVDRKIRLYGVISAMRKGKLPSNAQIDETLSYVLRHSPVDTTQLSPEGRKLVQDVKEIIATSKLIVQEKNADELVQEFIWRTRDVDTDSLVDGTKGGVQSEMGVDGEKVNKDKDLAVKHLRTILTLIMTNSEVRKLLSDFSLIGRDLLSIGASNLASTIAPHPDKLSQVDRPAPQDEFATEGGRKIRTGDGETPVLEARVPGTDRVVRNHPGEDDAYIVNPDGSRKPAAEAASEGKQAYDEYQAQGGATGIAMNQAREKGPDVVDRAKQEAPGVVDQAKGEAERHRRDVEEAEDPDAEVEAKKRGLMDRMRDMRDTINDKIPQKHKDMAKERSDRTREFFTEEYFPEERRDQFIFRLKKVIIECQKHDDYQQSMTWLLDAIKEYAGHGRRTAGLAGEHGVKNAKSSNLTYCIASLRTILERFANGQSMDMITDAIDALADDASRDQALREWFEAVDLYVRKVLLEPGYVLEPDCNNHANRLRDIGRQFYDEKYKTHFDNLFGSVGGWFKGMGDDPLNKQFGEDWARLTKDLLFDNEGSLKFKPELWNDIRKVILPKLIEQVGYVPIPRIEYSDDSLDLVVENLTLQGRNLFPNIVQMEANNFVKFSPYNAITDDSHHRIKLSLDQMQADMRDVAFYYRKKSGIPKMKDSGIADVILGGEGLSATIELVSSKRDKSSVFKVQSVNVKVDTLKFSIRDSNHDFLYKTLRPLATGLIKKQIQKAIRDALVTGFEYLDGQLVSVRDRMENAKREEGQNRAEVLKDIFNQKKSETASLARSADAKTGQFKIIADKRNSILAEQGHPAGWVNKVEERKEKVESGREWRSDVFKIV